jgi:outer membrane protein OmpA-like peptidoglycan-associated protein
MLTTRGYGDTKPRAQNDTEYGRFQNRRIEYSVVQ